MIVKVQISKFSSDGEQRVLIYDRPRRFMVEVPLSACLGIEGEDRAFYDGVTIVEGQIYQLGKRAPEQGW